MIHIPILRQGTTYASLDRQEVCDHRTGESLAVTSVANPGLIRRDLQRIEDSRAALQAVPHAKLLDICGRAADLFENNALPLGDGGEQTADEYVATLSATSGLPHTLCRANMGKVCQVLREMPQILRGLTRDLPGAIFDDGLVTHNGSAMCFYPAARAIGVVLPSNSPGVNSLWIPAIAMKIPVVIKPGSEEPWTPWRIIQALIAAGCPPEAFSYYPTTHAGADDIVQGCDAAIVFGDRTVAERYGQRPQISVHGPGHSKVIIGADQLPHWREYIDVLIDSVCANGGRSCINASTIVCLGDGRELAEALAERFAAITPKPMRDPEARLSAFASPLMADYIEAQIVDGLKESGAIDLTATHRNSDRRVEIDGSVFLSPTVVYCDSFAQSLANREFLFPYVAVVESSTDRVLDEIGPSLAVSVITEDKKLTGAVVGCAHIDRLNIGRVPTNHVQWDQPHEGNLFEFLFRRRAIQQAG
jgi:acyl-CoA reductase-like NAD-dependent aldehyde dehydrogenase